MPPERRTLTAGVAFGRRRLVQGLLLGPPTLGAALQAGAAATGRGASVVELGVVAVPGSGSQAAARGWASRWSARLGHAVAVLDLPPGTDALAWCRQARGATRLVLAASWQGATDGAASCPGGAASVTMPGLQTLAALARTPLVLMADRFMPRLAAVDPVRAWPQVLQAAQSAATPWRCGMDGSDVHAHAAALRLLGALGLGRADPVDFRGTAQLLPALAGARLSLALQTAGLCVGPRWQAMSHDETAGWLDGPVAAHRRGDVQLWAVAERVRLPGLPEVPTADELLGCAGNDIGRWQLLLAPADLDGRLARRLAAAAAATPWPA